MSVRKFLGLLVLFMSFIRQKSLKREQHPERIIISCRFKEAICLALVALAATYCTLPLFIQKSLPVSNDIIFHLFQADHFVSSFTNGVTLPRWISSYNNGYGSPNFIFYSPLSYYLVALMHVFIPSIIHSMIGALWCGFFLSGVSMYLATKKVWGDYNSLLCSIFYQILPFHLINLYVRGAYAELTAYIWFPILISCLHGIIVSNKKWGKEYVGFAISYAALILTHLVSGFIFTIVIIVFLFCYYIYSGALKVVLRSLTACVVGIGLSAFYLVPVIFERKFIQSWYVYNYVFSDYNRNFLFSISNILKQYDYINLPLTVIVILEIVLFVLISFSQTGQSHEGDQKINYVNFVVLFLFALFLVTPLSRPIWGAIPAFAAINFPWRWLTVLELMLCFQLGRGAIGKNSLILKAISKKNRTVTNFIALFAILSFLIIFSNRKAYSVNFLEKNILNPEPVIGFSNMPKEYTPIWAADLEKLLSSPKTAKISLISGKASINVIEWQSERRIIGVDAASPVQLRISTFYFPGWGAAADGKSVKIQIEKDTGTMLVDLGTGNHKLILSFTDTFVRFISKFISLIFCLILFSLSIFQWLNMDTRKNFQDS